MLVKRIAQKVQQEELSIDSIEDDTISQHLYTSASPDPDLFDSYQWRKCG